METLYTEIVFKISRRGYGAHRQNNNNGCFLFPTHLISRFDDVLWPPQSPDLFTCDCFLLSYLKERIVC